ncbi:MAG: Holliday junction branch migration protein RuvA [Candidatus Moranbacteria bacterium]|nr:Holliday junction branch migration protein RuvA [Candidatus Moranbacteria bacterium]
MLSYLKGTLISLGENSIVLEMGGIGLSITATSKTLENLSKKYLKLPAKIQLLTHLYIQENKWEIFGFLSKKERSAFLLLLNCRGIGTKAAINILNVLSPVRLKKVALGEESVMILQQVPGIGAKSADRVLVELKEKLPAMAGWEVEGEQKAKQRTMEYNHEDLVNALKNLGYRTGEIQAVVSQSSNLPPSLSEAIKRLLRALGKR